MAEDCISQCIVLQLPGKQLLVEVLAELKRPQARACAAELQRRLEHTYSKRHRHVEVARGQVQEIRKCL